MTDMYVRNIYEFCLYLFRMRILEKCAVQSSNPLIDF